MKRKCDVLSTISLNEAKAVIEWKDISFARLGEEKQKFSLTLKNAFFY